MVSFLLGVVLFTLAPGLTTIAGIVAGLNLDPLVTPVKLAFTLFLFDFVSFLELGLVEMGADVFAAVLFSTF